MHLELRKLKNSVKYYLAHSIKKEGKVKKIRVYLGTNLSEKELEEKRVLAEKELTSRIKRSSLIRDPFETVLSEKELSEINKIEKKRFKVFHLSEQDWLRFTESFTFNTNAIEGSTLSAKEVSNIIEENKLPRAPVEDIIETYGVAKAITYLRDTNELFSLQLILTIHKTVFEGSKTFAGKFREKGEEVVILDSSKRVIHRGAPALQVRKLLLDLVDWYEKNQGKYSPVVLAAVVHNQFENIHPFRDGNGRVGRLLLNYVLLKHGFPPVDIQLANRFEYYNALQAYENEHNLRPTIELILKEYRETKKKLNK